MVVLEGEPFDAIAEMAQGWDMRYDQLEGGRNVCALTQIDLGGVEIGLERVERTVLVRGTPPAGSIVFGLSAEPGTPTIYRGRHADPDTLIYQVSTEDLDVRFRGPLLSFVVAAWARRHRIEITAICHRNDDQPAIT